MSVVSNLVRGVGAVLAMLILVSAPIAFAQSYQTQDGRTDISMVPTEDQDMNAAIEKACSMLPRFWDALKNKSGVSFSVKVGMTTRSGGKEHIWVRDVARGRDGMASGILDNDPFDIPNVAMDKPVTFVEDDISDWIVICNGRMYGNFTTRVIIAHMNEADRARYANMLAILADGPPCAAPSA